MENIRQNAAIAPSYLITKGHQDWKSLGTLTKNLPDELLILIFNEVLPQSLHVQEHGRRFGVLALVCKRWSVLVQDNCLWRTVFMHCSSIVPKADWALEGREMIQQQQRVDEGYWKNVLKEELGQVSQLEVTPVSQVKHEVELDVAICGTHVNLSLMSQSQAQKWVSDTMLQLGQHAKKWEVSKVAINCALYSRGIKEVYAYLKASVDAFPDDLLISAFRGYACLAGAEKNLSPEVRSVFDTTGQRITDDSIWDNLTAEQWEALENITDEVPDDEVATFCKTYSVVEYRRTQRTNI